MAGTPERLYLPSFCRRMSRPDRRQVTNARDMNDSGSHSDLTTESTANELRKTGISVIGDVRWGTHFCYFYETKQDLLDTLAPYFKAGLENKEFCLWVISQPLTVEEAKHALGQAMPDLDLHLAKGDLEIRSHDEWYLHKGRCDPQRVLQAWRETLNQAFAKGYSGLRASGDGGWTQNDDWMVFGEYEKQVDALIADKRRILLCTYPLATSPGHQIFDVARTHQMAVARRHASWEMVETPELKEAKAEIKRLNDELELKIEERTTELRRIITERKLTEQALHESETRFRQIAENISEVFWLSNPEATLIHYVSPAYEKIWGRSCDRLYADPTSWMDPIHPGDRERVAEAIRSQSISGQHDLTYRIVRPDGSLRWIRDRAFPVSDKSGKLIRVTGIAEDMTERMEAQERLRLSETKFRRLLASNITGVVFWTLDGDISDANDLFLNMVGYTREDLRQRRLSWKNLTPPEYAPVDEKAIGELIATGTCSPFEKEYIRKDGSRVSVLIGSALLEPHKESGSSFVMDITERKRIELALAERLRFETLLTELSAAFANLPTTTVDEEIDKWLQNLVEFLDLDRATFDQIGGDGVTLSRSHSHTARGIEPLSLIVTNDQLPWMTEQLLRGNTIKWSRIPDDMPEQASREKEFAGRVGAKSVLIIPVCIGGSLICAISFTSMRSYRDWPDKMVARLRLVGEIFANAIARKRAAEALFRREVELDQAQSLASLGSWEWDIRADAVTWSDEVRRIYGFKREDLSLREKAFSAAIHPDDRVRRNEAIDAALNGGPPYNVEFRIIRPDKSVRFVHSRGRLIYDKAGKPVRMFGMAQDITERKWAAKELEEANHQLRLLSRRLFEVQEEERRHLARELHDEVGQALTAAKINLQSVTGNGGSAKFARLQETTAILDRLLGQVRQISLDLRPSMLDDLGLVPALRSLLDQQARRASVAAGLSAENIPEKLDPKIQTTCFRIAQEAITNALRHAGATRIDVDLQCDNGKFRLLIHDNGTGFDVESTQAQTVGLGLIGIQERATLIGGQARIISSPKKGTRIEVSLPLVLRGAPGCRD